MIGSFVSLFNNILAIFKSVTGPYAMFGLFLASLIYLLLLKDKRERNVFVYTSILILAVFFNPVSFWLLGKKILGDQSYCRMLWTIPQVFMMAYVLSDISVKVEHKKLKQAGVVILCILALMVSGRIIYNSDNFSLRENLYGIPDEIVTVVEAIETSDIEGQKTRVSAVPEIASCIRQIRTDLSPRFDREGVSQNGGQKVAYEQLCSETINVDQLIDAANSGHAYIIIKTSQDTPEFEQKGCIRTLQTENYVLYCLDNIDYDPKHGK